MFRIQKVLLADYDEIYEPVLVESPFAEVTEDGIGTRQVQMGLTPTKIIIGQDTFDKSSSCHLTKVSLIDKDPEIECFQLVSILPLDVLKVLFFKKRNRMIMHIKVLEEKSMFYEFGGYLSRNLFWNIWRERITTLRLVGPNLFNISGSSPFSSTDVIADEEEITVSIHPTPRTYIMPEDESIFYPHPQIEAMYKRFSASHMDTIEKASNTSLPPESNHQSELQNYFRSLTVTNTFSCGNNTSW